MAQVRRTMGSMLALLLIVALVIVGVMFWTWLYRWAVDVRDSLRRIADAADGGKPDPRTLMKPVVPVKR